MNIVGYENDHLVSPCIGMWHFERFRDRDGAGELPDASFMIIRSDHHGFPRMVASHYLPNAQAVDPLANWGYYKRIDAMADYLVMKVDGNGTGAGQARLYFTGGTNEMLDMGKWSDGRQMNRPHYSTDPFGLRGGDGLIEYIDEDGIVQSFEDRPKVLYTARLGNEAANITVFHARYNHATDEVDISCLLYTSPSPRDRG